MPIDGIYSRFEHAFLTGTDHPKCMGKRYLTLSLEERLAFDRLWSYCVFAHLDWFPRDYALELHCASTYALPPELVRLTVSKCVKLGLIVRTRGRTIYVPGVRSKHARLKWRCPPYGVPTVDPGSHTEKEKEREKEYPPVPPTGGLSATPSFREILAAATDGLPVTCTRNDKEFRAYKSSRYRNALKLLHVPPPMGGDGVAVDGLKEKDAGSYQWRIER